MLVFQWCLFFHVLVNHVATKPLKPGAQEMSYSLIYLKNFQLDLVVYPLDVRKGIKLQP